MKEIRIRIITPIVLKIEKGNEVSFKKNTDGLYVASVNNQEIGVAKELFPETKKKLKDKFIGIIESCSEIEIIAILEENIFK